jgi:hypothetical protein
MGARLTFELPADAIKGCQNTPSARRAPLGHRSGLRRAERNAHQVGAGLGVLEPVREHAKRQRLGPRNGLLARLALCQDACQVRHLGDPAAVLLAFGLDAQVHGWNILSSVYAC